jgi:hypothetical protein
VHTGEEQNPWGILGRAQHAVVAAAHKVADAVGNAAAEAASSAGALVSVCLHVVGVWLLVSAESSKEGSGKQQSQQGQD